MWKQAFETHHFAMKQIFGASFAEINPLKGFFFSFSKVTLQICFNTKGVLEIILYSISLRNEFWAQTSLRNWLCVETKSLEQVLPKSSL